jgi:F0F1-type ATP synthase delta subunit
MQGLVRRYVALLVSKMGTADDAFIRNFVAYIKKRKHESLLPQILQRLERMQDTRGTSSVTVASVSDAKKFAQSIASTLTNLNVEKGEYELHVDDRAVGGYMVHAKGMLVDRTYRSALVKLYQNTIQ